MIYLPWASTINQQQRKQTMHELSIAYSMVETVTQSALAAGATRVLSVRLRLGVLSGVVRGALEFGYEAATADTLLADSTLVVVELPVRIYCAVCDAEAELPSIQNFCCPHCNTPSGDVRQGRELEIESIEIDVPDAEDGKNGNPRT